MTPRSMHRAVHAMHHSRRPWLAHDLMCAYHGAPACLDTPRQPAGTRTRVGVPVLWGCPRGHPPAGFTHGVCRPRLRNTAYTPTPTLHPDVDTSKREMRATDGLLASGPARLRVQRCRRHARILGGGFDQTRGGFDHFSGHPDPTSRRIQGGWRRSRATSGTGSARCGGSAT